MTGGGLEVGPEPVPLEGRPDPGDAPAEGRPGQPRLPGDVGDGRPRELPAQGPEVRGQGGEGRIDAYLALTGNPSELVRRTLADCPSHLVDVTGPAIDKLVAERPYYARVTIPAASYGLPRPIETFGGSATLVTSAAVPERIVYAITKAALEGIEQLVDAVPPMAGIGPAQLAGGTLTAPLHPGAERAFREHGLRN